MKKFIVSEEEKLRILNLHESLKESILTPTKSTLNENVGPGIVRLLQGFKTTLKGSASIMSNLDDLARTFRNSGKIYGGNMRSGQDLLELFLAGSLSNRGVGDDMGVTLLTIFRSADDTQLIRSLAKEMVDGDTLLREGLLDGTINAVTAFGTKQGDELMDYVYRAYGRPTPFDPGGRYNPPNPLGNWNTSILPGYGRVAQIPSPGYAVSKLRAYFGTNPKAKKFLDNAEDEINKFIPRSYEEADQIVENNKQLIYKLLEKKGLGKQAAEGFIAALKKNWAAKGAVQFYLGLGILLVGIVINKTLGITGLTPFKMLLDFLGIPEGYQAAMEYLCKGGTGPKWACDATKSSGGGDAPDPVYGDMN
jgi:hypothetical protein